MNRSGSVTNNAPKKNNSWGWGLVIIILIFIIASLLCWGNYTESGRATCANIKSKFTSTGSVKSLDIVMFMSPTCPWCKKMIGVFEKEGQLNNITVIDMSKPEGQKIAKQFGADKQPVPSYISRVNKTGTVGYRETVKALLKDLEPLPPGSNPNPQPPPPSEGTSQVDPALLQGLQIILFSREGCKWCQKAKDSIAQCGSADAIQVVDITTPDGQKMAEQLLPPGTSGVPAWVSLSTRKHVVGFKPIEAIIQELQ
jgi:thiol-disulfide isomerase/thioredoxin